MVKASSRRLKLVVVTFDILTIFPLAYVTLLCDVLSSFSVVRDTSP